MLLLAYYGFQDRLYFREPGGDWKSIPAVSGGGRGQVHDGKPSIYGTNDALREAQRDWSVQSIGHASDASSTRGGPIPPGVYDVGTRPKAGHRTFGKHCAPIYLTMLAFNVATNTGRVRGNEADGKFYIHGRGRLGSDGCIVPSRGRADLVEVLDQLDRQGGGRLRVVQSADELRTLREADMKRFEGAESYLRTA